MLITKSPCRDCTQRSAECHANCGQYKEYEIKHAEEREKNRCQKQAYLRASDTQIAGMKRMQRGRRK